jgi:holo-[acyl-carrier protein] synthase
MRSDDVILGVGVDIVLLTRVESAFSRFGDRFSKKILSVQELSSGTVDARLLAKRFAVKEAIVKALGTGFRGGITMPSMSIIKTELNAPKVVLSGAALERLERLGGTEVLVSIADEVDSVIAFAIVQ